MNQRTNHARGLTVVLAAVLLLVLSGNALATIDGVSGSSFNLTARTDHMSTADGGSLLLWGYALPAQRAQHPGPTLIIQQGTAVSITLTNNLTPAQPTSIVFPGMEGVKGVNNGTCTNSGLLACEAPPGGTVTYTFTASQPGTYLYHSGTNPELQVHLGLAGAIIVRPYLGPKYAYNDARTVFDREYLFLLVDTDPRLHQAVEFQGVAAAAALLPLYHANYWFLNGRTAMDTMAGAGAPHLPTQPYDSLVLMHPGERVLLRVISAGRDSHPFHTHGNHARVIARDGRLLESAPGLGPDLATDVFTINAIPGETVDAIFEWTGKGLGWDIYGTATAHSCTPGPDQHDPVTKEYCPDHMKAFPVTLPETQFTTVGPFYSGSPFMGSLGALPPGEGGLNPFGGFPFMWHSHNERELTNLNIFPGGMLTMLIIVPPGVPIP